MATASILKCPYCEFRAMSGSQIFVHAKAEHKPHEWMHVARMTVAQLGRFFLIEEDAL